MVRRIRERICGLIPLKKLVYLISPNRIDQNFYSCLDKVLSLSGNTYTWIKGYKFEGQSDTGVIAQEVEALGLPGLTNTRVDGYKAVRYEKLIPVLIEAIKELKSEIEELKK